MKIEKGMKCKYICFGCETEGIVLYINEDGTFCCYKPMKCPPQYNDTFRDFKLEDIGKTVFFEGINYV